MPGARRKRSLTVRGERTRVKKWKNDEYKGKNKIIISYSPSICPDVMRVRLPYVLMQNLSGTGIAVNVFRGNSVFDPDFTGVGSQPLGRDQWTAFYRRYRVLASKVTFKVSSLDTADSQVMFITPLNTNTILSSRERYLEQERTKTSILSTTTGQNRGVLTYYMDTAKIRGVSKQAIRNVNDYSASSGSNPILEFYWHVGILDTSSLVDSIQSDIFVTVEYFVEFFDRETLDRS